MKPLPKKVLRRRNSKIHTGKINESAQALIETKKKKLLQEEAGLSQRGVVQNLNPLATALLALKKKNIAIEEQKLKLPVSRRCSSNSNKSNAKLD